MTCTLLQQVLLLFALQKDMYNKMHRTLSRKSKRLFFAFCMLTWQCFKIGTVLKSWIIIYFNSCFAPTVPKAAPSTLSAFSVFGEIKILPGGFGISNIFKSPWIPFLSTRLIRTLYKVPCIRKRIHQSDDIESSAFVSHSGGKWTIIRGRDNKTRRLREHRCISCSSIILRSSFLVGFGW